MKIISSFKDYYDCGMLYDQDRSIVYKRFPKIEEDLGMHMPGFHGTSFGCPMLMDTITIGFCGNIYPIHTIKLNYDRFKQEWMTKEICFNLDDIDACMERNLDHKQIDHYYNESRWCSPLWVYRKTLERYFQRIEERRHEWPNYFERGQAPIYTIEYGDFYNKKHKRRESSQLTYNNRLNQFLFYKIFNPQQAYQELSMYLGNLAEPRKPIPPISDEIMAEIKGFDKWSFRKQSTKKK